jgi:hypothetical protein
MGHCSNMLRLDEIPLPRGKVGVRYPPEGMPMSLLLPRLCVVLLLLSATARLAFAGEPEWLEVRSPHFSVITDAGEKRGREVALHFEQMRAVFAALMTHGAKVNLPIPLQIVAFRNSKEMRQFVPLWKGKPTQLAGLFQGGEDRCFIMLDMSVENPWQVVFHEYAHQLMNGNLSARADSWFEEGFAEYFSSIEVDSKEARVGKIPEEEYQILQQMGWIKIVDLFRVQQNSNVYNENGDHRTVFYAESGLVMHYIYDNQGMPQAGKYFNLTLNDHVPVEDAIQQAFGMSATQLDKALRAYLSSRRYKYYPIPTSESQVQATPPSHFLHSTQSRCWPTCICTLPIIRKRRLPSLRTCSRRSRITRLLCEAWVMPI